MDQGQRTKEATAGEITNFSAKIGGEFKVGPPTYQEKRLKLFQEIYQKQQEQLKAIEKPEITVTLKDGKQLKGKAFEYTPLQIAQSISKKLAENVVAAKIVYSNKVNLGLFGVIADADKDETEQPQQKRNYEIWDLTRPLEGDCTLELVTFEDNVGKEVFWHSSAHILGAALENVYGSHLCIGPPLDNGFFYDTYMGDHKVLSSSYQQIENAAYQIMSEKLQFERAVLTKEQALELFSANPFKIQLIQKKIPEGALTTAYRCGKLIDLCTGPHLPSTERVKAFKVTKNSAAYWLGKNTNDDLQRVYAIAFQSKKELDEYVRIQEELAKRDHRNVGKLNQLYMFHPLAPGCAFFYPDGTHIYNELQILTKLIRKQYALRGYSEVISPNLYNIDLFKISGHWDKYQENMFLVKTQEMTYGVKPMNCPGHCLMFDMVQHSYRELPIRYADFGVLHRHEVHGALSGLTRVIRFQQDDSHIYCRPDQIEQEISDVLDFLSYIYKLFGFEFKLYLSTRPEKYLGTIDMWDRAEAQLKESLTKWGREFEVNEGDGAFYGPKIDVKLFDAYKREHQCGTVQLDFNQPERFNLQYRVSEEKEEKEEGEEKQKEQKPKEEKGQKKQKEKVQKQQEKPTQQEEKAEQKEEKPVEEQKEGKQAGGKKKEKVKVEITEEMKEQQKRVKAEKEQKKKKQLEEVQQQQGTQPTTQKAPTEQQEAEKKKYEPGHLKTGFQRPVMIHRAILGSLERMIAVLTEQTGGKWPFWLSPKQFQICPVSQKFASYAEKLCYRLRLEGYRASVDVSDLKLERKIRNAQMAQYNYIGVVGEEEERSLTVDVRDRDKSERIGKFNIDTLLKFFESLAPEKADVERELMKKALYTQINEEYLNLNSELQLKSFLDGFEKGARDTETYAKLHDQTIDQNLFPNLVRWQNHMKHLEGKQQQ